MQRLTIDLGERSYPILIGPGLIDDAGEFAGAIAARDVLVATGGGAVLDKDTRERLRSRGCVVYLRTSVDQQLARTRRSTLRPLLMSPDPRGTLERLMGQRAALYEEVADVIVDTDGRKVGSVVDEIVRRLESDRSNQCSD